MTEAADELRLLARTRWRVGLTVCAVEVVIYFGFILLIAFDKPAMGELVAPGLSVGIVLGVLVILASWAITWLYVRWANRHLDARLARLQEARP